MFLLCLLAISLALLLLYIKFHYSYWQIKGFPYDVDSCIPFGSIKSITKHERSIGMAIYDLYLKTKERYIGIYLLYRPALLLRDVELVRKVLMSDFASFHDRGVYVDEKNDPLSASIFRMEGQSWRTMRTKLAPSFTSGKLKAMFGTAEDIGNKMIKHLESIVPESGEPVEIDMKEIATTYALDIIGSVIFGLEINSFENPKNRLRMLVSKVRKNTYYIAILDMLIFLCPTLAKIMFRMGFKNEVLVSLHDIMRETVEYREKHNIVRKDLLQLLIQLRNTGRINEDNNMWDVQTTASHLKSMSIEAITAQAFVFYKAGQESTSSTSSFTLFELAQQPDLLSRVNVEIEETLTRHGGQITYEALQEMKYLEACIFETLRKYPGLPMLNRQCTQDFCIPGTDQVIEKGTPILISLFGQHRDSDNFPNPDHYDPERFISKRDSNNLAAFMPFGEGPRHCIAQRMGKINAKLAIVKVLNNFNVSMKEKRVIEVDNFFIGIMPKGGVKCMLSRKPRKQYSHQSDFI